MEDEIKYEYKEITLAGSITEKGRKKSLDKWVQKMEKQGWELDSYHDGSLTKKSKVIFKRPLADAKKKSVAWIIIKWIMATFILLWAIAYINHEPMVIEETKEPVIDKQAIEKKPLTEDEAVNNSTLSINSISVSDGFTLNNNQAVSISLIENQYNYIMLTIEKKMISNSFEYDSSTSKTKKSPVSIQAFTTEPKKYYRFYNAKNNLKVTVNKYDKNKQEATFTIDTILNGTDNRSDIMELKNVAFTVKGKDFKLLRYNKEDKKQEAKQKKIKFEKKNTDTVKTPESSRKNIVSITSKNIKKVIKSLRNNYSINATAFDNGKLDKSKMCWNDRACEIYADKVQIQATYKTVEALTSSRVTPQYYQKVCGAIMIALTGANKELIEQQIPQYFNYASQNGRSRWEALGIEITISPDSSGLLGCSFYKR